MRVVLINPGVGKYNDSPPLNLSFIAAVLEQNGHEVKIIDKLSGENFETNIDKMNPDVAGITATTPVISDAHRCADYCRELGIYTIIGGVHPSILPEESLKHADTVVVGEGEITMNKLVDKRKDGIVQGEYPNDLNLLPMPAFHLLNMEFYNAVLSRVEMNYLSFAPSKDSKIASMLTSRGCPYNCLFCHNSYRTHPYRFLSPENVVKQIAFLKNEYNVDGVFFVEDNFFANNSRVKEFCKLLKESKLDIIWGANSRVDNINEEILRIAKDSGCKQVTFGWESGSQRILNILNKRTTVKQNYNSVRLCNKVGIQASGTVMIGNPTETEEDLFETVKFINTADITGPIGICITTPYPGTGLWEWCVKNNKIPKIINWEDYDFHHLPLYMAEIPIDTFKEIAYEISSMVAANFQRERIMRGI